MKVALKTLLVICAFVACFSAKAQTDFNEPQFARFGADAASREVNFKSYSFFNEAYNAKNYPKATFHLKELLDRLPNVHQNLYIKASAIYKRMIAREKDVKQRAIYIDSLMILHDYRLKYFGDDAKRGKAYILTEKIKDNINYRANNSELVIETVNEIVDEVGSDLNVEIIPVYFNYLTQLYSNDAIETDVLLTEYEMVNGVLDGSEAENKGEIKTAIEQMLMGSGAASCENLEKIFKPQFEANPDDKDLIAKIASTLSRAQCSSDFQLAVAEKYYTIEPTASAAASLAFGFDKKGDLEKALQYYDEAIEKETDNKNKAAFALSAAGATLLKEQYSKTVQYARKAIAIDDQNGLSYYLLAQAQAASLPNCGAFQKSAAFWVIVDNLVRARGLLSGDQADQASQLISTYSSYFPSADDIFFNELTPGNSYTVNCGAVSGTTTVRARK